MLRFHEDWTKGNIDKSKVFIVHFDHMMNDFEGLMHDIIDFVFDSSNLPMVNDENYMDRWGEARSEKRLKMLVHSLSGFIRLKENHPDDNSAAISDWEDDLNYIKEEISLDKKNQIKTIFEKLREAY